METGIIFILENEEIVHSWFDLQLKQLAELSICPAVPKRHLISEVAGMDGQIDLTPVFGPVRFENRTITAGFEGQDQNYDEWCEVCSRTYNALHGKYARIVMDIDQDWYWDGFLTVTPEKEAIVYSHMEISMDVYPYKFRQNEYLKKASVTDGSRMILINDRMPVRPEIASDADIQVTVNGKTYDLTNGANRAEFELTEGENVLEFTGTANVEIRWRGGSL